MMSYLEYVRGPVEGRGVDWVVIDVGGLGMRVNVLAGSTEALPTTGEARLWTYLHVREDVRAVYGFRTPEERAVFVQLLGVSGVGPKMAMALLLLGPERLATTIDAGDEAALAKAPGVGKKTAQRIILELKGKIQGGGGATAVGGDGDVLDALVGAGLSRAEALAVLAQVPPDPSRTIQETIILAFQAYGARKAR
jgi:holliday junction DNA helicase RuvA